MKAIVGFVLVASLAPSAALALPQYAMRSGRTCGNCHISPTYQDPKGWDNPVLAARKCNMSCMACHVNPNGGGLRNTSGRYYGQSTLSIFQMQERSYSDYDRELISRVTRARFMDRIDPGLPIPSNYEQVGAGVGAGRTGGLTTFGKPLASGSEYAFWDGRYGDLNADPLLQLGGDLRMAYWSGSSTFFPMQFDLHAAVHPVEHLTFAATLAARGRVSGPLAVVQQDRLPVFVRNAYVMTHELPYMTYAKAGIFMPGFGTYIDDHTSFTREYFELDVSKSEDTVLGVEIGTAPNYPYASVSAFRGIEDGGFGMAANAGWRDLGWSLGAHAMMKRRDIDARGDMNALGIGWGFNPMYYANFLPLTYLGEFSIGRRERPITGDQSTYYAMMHELWITIFNGVSARLKYDLGRRDIQGGAQLEHRLSLGADISPVTGVTFVPQVRVLFESDQPSADFFVHAHLWF